MFPPLCYIEFPVGVDFFAGVLFISVNCCFLRIGILLGLDNCFCGLVRVKDCRGKPTATIGARTCNGKPDLGPELNSGYRKRPNNFYAQVF